ncbi:uncharacterized protein IL334_001906 [Kwoniella shivajii]|uniref:Metallo-beta-lactamase domain-containing protein n=1 Tax=Kwoniella shivajii TaxID=564305 RepID=A0ABZ1CTK5_9TREE|nr:hypothetical protein IL334_001906 [Kwoniella shivajii]
MSNSVNVKPFQGERVRKEHWVNDKGTSFKNPWKTFRNMSGWDLVKIGPSLAWDKWRSADPTVKDAKNLIPHMVPNFGANIPSNELKITWLGHACCLVETPTKEDHESGPKGRGVRTLFDPVLFDSMARGFGPKRQSKTPCKIEDLPEIDIIAISHNHYDHLDLPSLEAIYKYQKSKYDKKPLLFLPLNNYHVVSGLGLGRESVIEVDWWEEREIVVDGIGEIKLICTPGQHTASRSGWDKDNSLWSSWAIKDTTSSASVWFGGDTGYNTMHVDSHSLADLPEEGSCPAFKDIGDRLGPFTVGLIPIGAYAPRIVMSPVHAAPIDSVRMFKDTACKNAVGIHWGTFQMTTERFTEPPEKLKEAAKEIGLAEDDFIVVALGESKGYAV